MRIRKSLLLLVVFLGLALLVNLLALGYLARTVAGSMPVISEKAEQQLLSVQMQAQLCDSEAALYRYLMEGDPDFKRQFKNNLSSFRADVQAYRRSASSDRELQWASALAQTHGQADDVGSRLARLRDAQEYLVVNTADAEIQLNNLLAHQVRAVRPESDAVYHNAVSGMLEYLNQMSLAIVSYLAFPDAAERVRFNEADIGFQHHLNAFNRVVQTPQEQYWSNTIDNLFSQIKTTGMLLFNGRDRQDQRFASFAAMLQQAGTEVLSGQIQPQAATDLAQTQQQLRNALNVAIGSSLFVALVSTVIAGAVTWPLLRRLDSGIRGLVRGADRVSHGDLSRPVALSGNDELSQLAGAFNGMMADLAAREQRLKARLSELEALRQVSLQLTGTLDPERVLNTIASSALRLVNATEVRIFVVNQQQLDFAASACAESIEGRPPRIPREEGIIAVASRTGQPQVINHADRHPLYTTPETRAWGVKASASFPLKQGQLVIGVMGVSLGDRDEFSEDNLRILQLLSDQAAIALENARLYEGMARREARVRTLAEKLAHIQEEERRLIGLDLHDGLTQLLLSANMHLNTFTGLAGGFEGQPAAELNLAHARVREAINEARWVVSELRPAALEDFGLVSGLRQYATELSELEKWQLEFAVDLGSVKLNPAVETAIFRIAQEALTNARKYGRPKRVRVALQADDTQLTLEVQDWGRGFNVADLPQEGQRLGLEGMRERALLLGGELTVESQPGQGTRIVARIPRFAVEEQ
ncbi:MAG: GAF domain-containing protein [Chloroflexi bacterium]|nr:MAG: GAF domain-containing protein [Chloroflexota bacterium]